MITLTPITWTARVGPEHTRYGLPYEGVATIQRCGDSAYVSAACGNFPLEDQIELSKLLKEIGFTSIIFERIKHGKVYSRKREL